MMLWSLRHETKYSKKRHLWLFAEISIVFVFSFIHSLRLPLSWHNPTHNPKHNFTHNLTLEHNTIQFSILGYQPTPDAQNNIKTQRQACCYFCSFLDFSFPVLSLVGEEELIVECHSTPETPPTFENACPECRRLKVIVSSLGRIFTCYNVCLK